jgi:hypothetical protein
VSRIAKPARKSAAPPAAPDVLTPDKEFSSLSLVDLLEARDLYHLHLLHKQNVVATAVGRYRIRRAEPWPDAANKSPPGPRGKRTLENSEVRPYSWPCILVFVDRWLEPEQFHAVSGAAHPEDMVPRALYMPDGKVVPVCVVEAAPVEPAAGPAAPMQFPSNLVGGGYPLVMEVQGQERVASAGCLVTDGHLVYALTNRHVAGAAGEPVYSLLAGKRVEVGHSSNKQLTRLPFSLVYPDWPGKNVYLHLDVGLVEVADATRWTAQVYGVGELGRMADLGVDNLTLRLIGCPVRAYGCASRDTRGEVTALFYRYKSVGGFEYVADFLIGPRGDAPFRTGHGDSGTLWLLEKPDEPLPLPLAVQWGGHAFAADSGTGQAPYALATCLSTVCNLLEVDLVRDLNTGQPEFWGMVGHYTIANRATTLVRNPRLRQLMKANLERITFQADAITPKQLKGTMNRPFVPLADVPDLVWKLGHGPVNRGQPEHPNHFADMDKPRPDDGKTLLDLCKGHPENVAVDVWRDYYTAVGDQSRGLLPFRSWQIYQEMVDAVEQGDAARFVCTAGVLSHYVGDACQPLHISFMFNGIPQDDGTTLGEGVHAAYEDAMVDRHAAEIMAGIDQAGGNGAQPALVKTGQQAAVAVVELMQKTFDAISPKAIVDAYVNADGGPAAVADSLWGQFGDATVAAMVQGCRYLAMLWDSAWKQGGGDSALTDLSAVAEEDLVALYERRDFLPSKTLDKIGPLLQ